MARIRGHATLKQDKPLYVLKAELRCDGRLFHKGELFPWQELGGLTPRILKLLWDQRQIGHEKPEDPAQGAEDPLRSPQEQAKADERDSGRSETRKPSSKPKPAGARGLG